MENNGYKPQDAEPVLYRRMKELETAVNEHGEVHLIYEDVDAEIGVRKGPTEWYYDTLEFTVYDGSTRHTFKMEKVSTWNKPFEVFE